MTEARKATLAPPNPARQAKKPYETPRVRCFGNLRDITLGASQGFGESTAAGIRKGGPGS